MYNGEDIKSNQDIVKNNILKAFTESDDNIEKGRTALSGEIHQRKNGKSYQKQSDGSWKELTHSKFKGERKEEKPEKVSELEKLLGVEFNLYKQTGSLYGEVDGVQIRLADHPSKFTEKKGGLDLNYESMTVKQMYNKIKDIDPFEDLKSGKMIPHRRLGKMKFVSYNKKDETVTVINNEGETKKYWKDVFLI